MTILEELFESIGGEFVTHAKQIRKKLLNTKAFIFDWDGVFNAGLKGEGIHSPYSEADSMGTNLLRFSYWLRTNKLPYVAIITGQENKSAFHMAKREHFHAVYYNFKYKMEALDHIEENYKISPKNIAFCFDDVLDLSIASKCGLKFMIRRDSSPLFSKYVKQKHLCDYISGSNAESGHAIREIAELIMGLKGVYTKVLNERIAYTDNYQEYASIRNSQTTKFFNREDWKTKEKTF